MLDKALPVVFLVVTRVRHFSLKMDKVGLVNFERQKYYCFYEALGFKNLRAISSVENPKPIPGVYLALLINDSNSPSQI